MHSVRMNKTFSMLLIGICALLAGGCYNSLDGRMKGGVPWVNDTKVSRYERPVDQLFEAAKEASRYNGTLYGENTINHTLEAKIDTRTVWVSIDEVEPGVSRVRVQARSKGGAADIGLASEIDKQIALRLPR